MFEEYIKNGAFNLEALEGDLFGKYYNEHLFDYNTSRYPEIDWENARWEWELNSLFEQAIKEQLEDKGYRTSDGHARGQFVWIREFDLLMVRLGSEAVPDATFSFNRLEIDDIEFATGVVRDGLVYPLKTAEKMIL